MEHRHERRALPALGDVGGAEVVDDRDSQAPRQCRAVAKLHRQLDLGAMQHRLAVEADDLDRFRRNAVLAQEHLDRLAMRGRHEVLGRPQAAGSPGPLDERRRIGERTAQEVALGVGVGAVPGRPERHEPLAVGLDERDIDAVERRAAHQPDGPHQGHALRIPVKSPPEAVTRPAINTKPALDPTR